MVNGKGDRELYRVPREGGAPVAITNTPRDEFAPAVSPDGKLVAHVSNHLGNLDLFVMPIAGGEKTPCADLAVEVPQAQRPRARQSAATRRASRRPCGCTSSPRTTRHTGRRGRRCSITDSTRNSRAKDSLWPMATTSSRCPRAALRLVAIKGVEYRIEERSLDIAAGQTAEITITMQRWTNWAQKGWYTGENHFHANYNGSYYQQPAAIRCAGCEAEDLNTANMIVANSEGAFIHDKEFFKGMPDPASKPRYVLYWGQEYRNSDPLGHHGISEHQETGAAVVHERGGQQFAL